MKKLILFILFITFAIALKAQINSGLKVCKSFAEMEQLNLNIGTTVTLDTADVGGQFIARDASGRTIDNGITFPTLNPAIVLVRDVSQSSLINVKWFRVAADSVTDDGPKIQLATDVASSLEKILYFPSGNYKIMLPILLRKDAHWLGDGYKSFLFNGRSTSVITGDTYDYFMGNFVVSTYDSTLAYSSSDTLTTGSNIVTLTSAQTDSFSVGGLILIESPTGYHGAGGYLRPYFAEINKVIAIDRGNGLLFLKHPMDTTLPVAIIRNPTKLTATIKTDVLGNPYYIADNCSIDNMRMSSSDYVAKRYGAFECNITHNYFHSAKGVGGNGLSWCNFLYNTLEFSYKAVEYAFFSSDTHIERNNFIYFHGLDDGDIVRPGIKMGENVRNCTFSYNTVQFGDNYVTGPIVSFDHAFNNEIVGNKIYAQNIQQNAFDVRAIDDSVKIINNYVANNEVWADSVNSFINLSRGSTNATVSRNRFIDNVFHGTPKSHAYWLGGDNNVIVDNYVDAGDVTMDARVVNPIVSSQSATGNLPYVMVPYKPAITPKIKGAIESIDGYHLYYVDSFGARHQIPYPDTVIVMGDANYNMAITDRIINLTTTLTAARTVNLFAAALVPAGTRIIIQDFTGSTNSTNYLNIVHSGSNTVNGAGNIKIQVPYGQVILFSDGVSQWNYNPSAVSIGGTVMTYASASITSSATPSPTGDSKRNELYITALATNPTFSAPSGTPANGNVLYIRILDNGTSRTLSWNAIYTASTDLPLPSSTTVSKTMDAVFYYNSTSSHWELKSYLNNTP